ncbi:MAG: hypothetical protein MZU95_00525 [Desulfomicrobium escambiense]|nr:hypothetical protein [Desulfomicrobium escambiense]
MKGHGKIDDLPERRRRGRERATSRSRSCAVSRSSSEGLPVEEMPRIVTRICGV